MNRKITNAKDIETLRKMINDPRLGRFEEWDCAVLELLDDIDCLKDALKRISEAPIGAMDLARAWALLALEEDTQWPREEDE